MEKPTTTAPSTGRTARDLDRVPCKVRFASSVVVGGQTVDFVENKPRELRSFRVNWERRVVLVEVVLSNGWVASGMVPFENVAWMGFENEERRA